MMRKGVSPVIATTLLIAIVITLAGIVFIWAQGFVQEGVHKRGEPIERSCQDIDFEAAIYREGSVYTLEVNNQADIPLYGFVVKALGRGEALAHELPPSPIESGASAQILIDAEIIGDTQELIVIPILLGQKGDAGREPFTCPDASGIGITIDG